MIAYTKKHKKIPKLLIVFKFSKIADKKTIHKNQQLS